MLWKPSTFLAAGAFVDVDRNVIALRGARRAANTGDLFIQRHTFSPTPASESLQLQPQLGVYTRADGLRWNHDGAEAGPIPLQPDKIDR